MPQNETIEVVNQLGERLSVEMSWEDDIWKVAEKLRIVLMFLSYPTVTIDKILPKEK